MIPAVDRLPRVRLGFYPTPLTEAEHLSSTLGGPRILIKREDLSGLALGGNKCRKLEFIFGKLKDQGVNAVITTAGSQSNWCMQVAAAARKLGMKPSLVLIKGRYNETQGNLLLDNILGADVEILETTDMHEVWVEGGIVSKAWGRITDDLRAKGYKPATISGPGEVLGHVGWVPAAEELMAQLKDQNIEAPYVVFSVGGGGTMAGFLLGSKYLGAGFKVIGNTVLMSKDAAVASIIEDVDATSDFLGLSVKVTPDEFEINDAYVGEGYGIPTREGLDAIRLVAETEGIFLDPVYTGKGMAGLIDLIKKGRFKPTDTIIFMHTGGIPALFAYDEEIAQSAT